MNSSVSIPIENQANKLIMENYLNIPTMLYEEKDNGNTVFFFSGLPIMKLLSQVPKSYRIADLKLLASNYQFDYISNNDITKKQTITDLIDFFSSNTQYSIDDMDARLNNNINISIHDDNEITFLFPKGYSYNRLVNKLLTSMRYNSTDVISQLTANKSQYLLIERPDKLVKKYVNFNEYLSDNE